MKKNKAYFVSDNDEYGVAVVATSAREAKIIGHKYMESEWGECEYIDVRTSYKKYINVDKYSIGVMDDLIEGLRLGIYGYVEECECPICMKDNTLYKEDGIVGCGDCIEKKNKK